MVAMLYALQKKKTSHPRSKEHLIHIFYFTINSPQSSSSFSSSSSSTHPPRTVTRLLDYLAECHRRRYDQKTGEMVNNSKAVILNTEPDDPDHVDIALFVDNTDEKYDPGSKQTVQMCDFANPEACEKKIPYMGAPDYYECGESDEKIPETGFKCVNITAVTDDDGDLSLIDEVDAPMSMCPGEEPIDEEKEEKEEEEKEEKEEEEDEEKEEEATRETKTKTKTKTKTGTTTRRRLMASARGRRRPGARSRSIRTAGLRGFGGRPRRGGSRRG